MGLNGVLVMLSFLARYQLKYQLAGSCPEPPESHLIFEDEPNPIKATTFFTAMYFESDIKKKDKNVFGTSRAKEDLNCLRFTVRNRTEQVLLLMDCGLFEGTMSAPNLVNTTSYNMTLKDVDPLSNCMNQTSQISNISVFADEKKDLVIFWSCFDNYKKTSHKQVIVVFISSDIMYELAPEDAQKNLDRVIKFTEATLWFSRVNITENFIVNERLLVDQYKGCDSENCTGTCDITGSGHIGGPIIFFLVILFIVIIVFLVVL